MPAALAGYLLADLVEGRLGRPAPTAVLLAGAGIALWAADLRPQDRPLDARAVVAASVAQVVALAPGVSRAGATLTALRLARVERKEALRFSTLMSLPVTAGAAGLSLWRARGLAKGAAVGAPVAAVTGFAASRVLSRRADLLPPGAALYRLGVAAAVAVRLRRQQRT